MERLGLLFVCVGVCVYVCVCAPDLHGLEIKITPLFICALSVHTDRWWLGQSLGKTLFGHFSACFLSVYWSYMHSLKIPLTFLALSFNGSLKGKLYTIKYLKVHKCEWYVSSVLGSLWCWHLIGEVFPLRHPCCIPHFSPLVFFWLFKYFTYQHCWSHSPRRNLWPLGLLPSAAYGLLWMILQTDSEGNKWNQM